VHSRPAERAITAFQSGGVGLITFDGSQLTRVVDASQSSVHDWRREYVLSRVVCK
jgi:hypothetical protein